MNIETFRLGPFDTNSYLLTDDKSECCAVVDAPPGAWETIAPQIRARKLKVESLLLTHGHWDHIADADFFANAGATLYAHRADIDCFEKPDLFAPWYRASLPWLTAEDFRKVVISRWIKAGDSLTVLGRTFAVRHVPGHCPGNVLFYQPEAGVAFPGDAIFAGSVGRSDLPGGSWAELLTSIRESIYTLPDATVLLPGHGEATTVGIEKASNPYARPLL
ncbi:MAG: MBL fold metallo-hydrolase [Puniceicoccales bacterium]|jgi:glyoxylase-like metal-dependent hydrolase (beta-lactamase superfamily II)|nr:MBL fold metallo-hydrolase [Puniceicoccales bacterium]